MSDNPSSPLLGAQNSQQRPPSQRSESSSASTRRSKQAAHTTESTPLLASNGDDREYGDAADEEEAQSPAETWLRNVQHRLTIKGRPRRWPTVLALSILVATILVILGLGFAAPAVVEEYAREAIVFEPTHLSIDSFTSTGVLARVQGDFKLDSSKVKKRSVRDLGRAATWIAKAVESKESHVEVYLPEYGNLLLGTAEVPSVKVSIRDGVKTHIDIMSDLSAGDIAGVKGIAQDWIRGSVESLSIHGVAQIPLKSGIFSLGTQYLTETMTFAGNDIPDMPAYNISRLNFHEKGSPNGQNGMAADVILNVANKYPLTFTVPPMGFHVLVDDCSPDLPHIHFADALTEQIDIESKQDIVARVRGFVGALPDSLTKACPSTEKSPLDSLVGDYIRGEESTIYIEGGDPPSPDTPEWIVDFMRSITLPVSFPGKSFGNLIRNFSLEDVHFGLPDPFANPKSPESLPRISAVVKALVGLPEEMNFPLNIPHVRASCEVFYHHKKLGELDLKKWQEAKSRRIEPHGDIEAGLLLEAVFENAPLEITDENVFSDVVQDLMFGDEKVVLGVKADVDVETETVLGKFVVRDVPAEGKVFVKPISDPNSPTSSLVLPKINDIRITSTTTHTLTLAAQINITNPTPYSANIPYVDILLLCNGTTLGHITMTNATIGPGNNTLVPLTATWDPDGLKGDDQGRELLSQYISGFNTNLTFRTHNGTIPTFPVLGHALSRFNISIPTPRLSGPSPSNGDGDGHGDETHHHKHHKHGEDGDGIGNGESDKPDDRPHFIKTATFHLLSSTATFTLVSPLRHNTLHLTYLNATAYYNHTNPVGRILQPEPEDDVPPIDPDDPMPGNKFDIEIPPGESTTPAVPVAWDISSIGFKGLKDAVGGSLKLDAEAEIEVRVKEWRSGRLWFLGRGLGAGVRFLV